MKQSENRVDLLGIAAHPDDIELSAAGTLLMAKRAGKKTGILDLTRGELSTRGTLESRARETEAASEILQLDWRKNMELADGNIEINRKNMMELVKHIRQTRPRVMLTPHTYERHPDHEAASELAHQAAFYAGLAKIETQDDEGNLQEPHRPLLVLHFMQTYTFEPKVIIDVTDVFEERMKAMQAYDSQFGRSAKAKNANEPETFLTQKGFYEWIEARSRHYGMIIGVQYAEPFWAHEPVGTKDIFSLVTKKIA